MTSFQITETRNFMARLLGTDCFDGFLLESASIASSVTYAIDGRCNRDFYTKEEWSDPLARPFDFVPWQELRPLIFSMIKGKRPPVSFQFVLHLMPRYLPGILRQADASLSEKQVRALVLTIRYENGAASLVTGTSFTTFVMDKSLDCAWDKAMRRFLQKKGIAFSER